MRTARIVERGSDVFDELYRELDICQYVLRRKIKTINGTIMSDCFGPNVYHNGLPNDRYTVRYTYFDEWIGLVDEFYDNIRNHKTPLINLKWHRRTIEVMNAVYESIKDGKVVRV